MPSPSPPPEALPETLPEVLRPPLGAPVGLLLESRIPARLAWVGNDGTPRVVAIWFLWTGDELAMSTFAGAQKLSGITEGTIVAVTIDTDTFPYRSLKLRGPVTVRPVDGLAEEYRLAAQRYLGEEMASRWLEFLDGATQVVLSLRPTWARAADMNTDSPFMTD